MFRWPAIRHEGEMTNYGTTTLPRTRVVPGMLVKYQGRTYRASANVGKGLYLFTLFERLRITNEEIEVYLNQQGKPATH
ncbi:cell division protein FtsZ [Salmonella enterica]|nr:cell division protein FtsZ [Salmonella enterica]